MNLRNYIYSDNKPRRIAELLILYGLLPVIVMLDIWDIPLMAILLFMGITVYLFLIYDPAFDRRTFLNWKQGRAELGKLLLMFGISAIVMLVLILWGILLV